MRQTVRATVIYESDVLPIYLNLESVKNNFFKSMILMER